MAETERILLVEDDSHIREFVVAALKSEGYTVFEADSAAAGASLADMQKPQLLLLDLGLPDQDGIEFIRDLRRRSTLPILIISARTQETEKVAALDSGADDYLSKPFGVAELLARVRALLRRAASPAPLGEQPISFGDFSIDQATRSVLKNGLPLRLSQIEYRLLLAMVNKAGHILTHRQLLLEVWGDKAAENHEYLRVYVGHLRQKIEINPAQPRHILTEIGVGYRFQR